MIGLRIHDGPEKAERGRETGRIAGFEGRVDAKVCSFEVETFHALQTGSASMFPCRGAFFFFFCPFPVPEPAPITWV